MVQKVEPFGDQEPVLADALSNPRRRSILHILRETDAPLALADLTRELLTREQDVPLSELDREQIRACQIELYHNHVPKLADAGVVKFDTDRRVVALTETAPALPMVTLRTGSNPRP